MTVAVETLVGRPRMNYPKTYESVEDLPSVARIVREVLPRLLEGDNPILVGLRAQLRQLVVSSVEMTGVGFFAELLVPLDIPTMSPAHLVGGNADIELTGVENGAGCVLFVDDGRLSTLEGYTFGGEEWRTDAFVLSICRVFPLEPPRLDIKA